MLKTILQISYHTHFIDKKTEAKVTQSVNRGMTEPKTATLPMRLPLPDLVWSFSASLGHDVIGKIQLWNLSSVLQGHTGWPPHDSKLIFSPT